MKGIAVLLIWCLGVVHLPAEELTNEQMLLCGERQLIPPQGRAERLDLKASICGLYFATSTQITDDEKLRIVFSYDVDPENQLITALLPDAVKIIIDDDKVRPTAEHYFEEDMMRVRIRISSKDHNQAYCLPKP